MGKALIIGAGGVAGVVVHKCCQNSEVFTEICIASRTKSKCDALKAAVEAKGTKTVVTTAQVDANKVDELGVTTVLTIENPKHKIAQTVVENTKEKNQKILALNSMQSVTSDDVKNGETYLNVMQSNFDVLKQALN